MQRTLQAAAFPAAAAFKSKHTPWHNLLWHLPAGHPCWADLHMQPVGRLWSDLDRQLLETVTILRQVVRDECQIYLCLQRPCRSGRPCAVRRPQNILCTCSSNAAARRSGRAIRGLGGPAAAHAGVCRMGWEAFKHSHNASLAPGCPR